MQYSMIIYEKKDRIAKITMNRPEVLNALNVQLIQELKDALTDIANDDSVGVVVLTGSGRAFSAGVDIKTIDTGNEHESSGSRKRLSLDVIDAIENLDKPVIAAINGYCLTGALELVIACDLIIASENATIGDTHARWGLYPIWGGSQRLPRLIGPKKTKEMFFLCDMLTAKEAEQIGLVNKVVAPDKLDEAVDEMANKILANSQEAIRIEKSLINRGLRMDYASALKMEEAEALGAASDSKERLQTFKDRFRDKDSAKPKG